MQDKIMQWIVDQQKGKSGIYPYRVAEKVSAEFNISIENASEYVLEHIKAVLGGAK